MATPLTDAINALITYANSVTGASDTTLSDAVHTLASGYGGGGGSTRTVIIPEQTINVSTAYNQISRYNELFVAGEEYICTVNGTEYVKTAVSEYGSVNIHIDGWDIYFEKTASNNMMFDVENSAKYGTYTIKVEKQTT
jgi:hypothetical protein